MLLGIPPSITEIQPSNEPYFLINDYQLLVMGPQSGQHCCWMSQHFDVTMHRFKISLRVQ